MALFLSTFINKVDKKGRVSAPASFRAAVAEQSFQGLVLFKSQNHNALEGFSMGQMESLSERLDHFDMFSDEQDDIATSIFAESLALPFDSDGRIILPQPLMDYAQISDQAAFIGLGNKFQIWSPALLETRKQVARKKVQDKKLTLPPLPQGGKHG